MDRHERIAITQRTLTALKTPARDTVLWDRTTRRFGIRLTPGGTVSFLIQYRNAQGRSRRLTIGTYPKPWTPALAREEAERLLRVADSGGDPQQARLDDRSAVTFRQLMADYLEKAEAGVILKSRRGQGGEPKGGHPKKASTLKIDRYRAKHLVGHFKDIPVKDITRQDCLSCLQKLMAGRHGAARCFGLLGAVFAYAVDAGIISASPAKGVIRPADGRRSFQLDAAGYNALGLLLEAADARLEPWQAMGAIRLLALTGCRKGEILKLRLSEVDLQGRCLRLDDSKTGQSMRALGEPAVRVLRAFMNRPGRPESPYLFPGRDPRKPFNGLGGAWERIVGNSYTPHGLRHAFASTCDELGLSELTTATLLGHASARTGATTRGYITKPDAVLLAAADKASGHIWKVMTDEQISAEVISLDRAG